MFYTRPMFAKNVGTGLGGYVFAMAIQLCSYYNNSVHSSTVVSTVLLVYPFIPI